MRIVYAILADAAAAVDGKFYIHGGDLTRITPPVLPWTQSLAVAIKIEPEIDLSGTAHRIHATLVDADDQPLHTLAGGFELELLEHSPDELPPVLLAFTLSGMLFQHAGRHMIKVTVDQEPELQFPVTVLEPRTQG